MPRISPSTTVSMGRKINLSHGTPCVPTRMHYQGLTEAILLGSRDPLQGRTL